MSEEKSKSSPIPTRHDPEVVEMVERLSEITGLGKAEIIRRAVRFALSKAKTDGSLNFLLGDPDEIRNALQSSSLPPETPNRVYPDTQPSSIRMNEPGHTESDVPGASPGDSSRRDAV